MGGQGRKKGRIYPAPISPGSFVFLMSRRVSDSLIARDLACAIPRLILIIGETGKMLGKHEREEEAPPYRDAALRDSMFASLSVNIYTRELIRNDREADIAVRE